MSSAVLVKQQAGVLASKKRINVIGIDYCINILFFKIIVFFPKFNFIDMVASKLANY